MADTSATAPVDGAGGGSNNPPPSDDAGSDAMFTSPYGFHEPGTKWNPSKEKGEWKWIRRLSANHPATKQPKPSTHMCIKPMPGGAIGCGGFYQNGETEKEPADKRALKPRAS
jgi:hypothetical protein